MHLQHYDIYIGQSLYHDIDFDLTAMPIVYLGIFLMQYYANISQVPD